jgi:hypothetical protein
VEVLNYKLTLSPWEQCIFPPHDVSISWNTHFWFPCLVDLASSVLTDPSFSLTSSLYYTGSSFLTLCWESFEHWQQDYFRVYLIIGDDSIWNIHSELFSQWHLKLKAWDSNQSNYSSGSVLENIRGALFTLAACREGDCKGTTRKELDFSDVSITDHFVWIKLFSLFGVSHQVLQYQMILVKYRLLVETASFPPKGGELLCHL